MEQNKQNKKEEDENDENVQKMNGWKCFVALVGNSELQVCRKRRIHFL